jgi:spermidine synthase
MLEMSDDWASYDAFVEFLSTPLDDGRPFVLETKRGISLHFDHFAIQSSMSRRSPDELVLGYTRTMMGFLLLQPQPEHICMIGLGGGSQAKYCYRRLPESTITAIEISAEVIALRDVFRIPADDGRFKVICADGAEYMRDAAIATDVILLDAFGARGMSDQCANFEFFATCRERLTDSGVLVVNFTGDDPGLPFHVQKLEAVFGISYALVSCSGGANYVGFAWKDARHLPSRQALLAHARSMSWVSDLRLSATARRLKDGECLDWRHLVRPSIGDVCWRIDA